MGDYADTDPLAQARHTLTPNTGKQSRVHRRPLRQLPYEIAGLFCSLWCTETARVVRYARGTLFDGRAQRDPLVVGIVQLQLAHLLNGGYNKPGRRLSLKRKAEVRSRDDGRCQMCGKPGTEVHHVDGDSAAPSNLQLLCSTCHNLETAKNLHSAAKAESELLKRLLWLRVAPPEPALLADDPDSWGAIWLGLRKARKQRLIDRMHDLGIETTGLRSWSELVRVLKECVPEVSSDRYVPVAPTADSSLG